MVTKSLWQRGSLGEVGVTRITPRRDGLVLWLPLYRQQGSSIYSEEGRRHLCTVTGALWTPQGRDFDGSDDHIDCGTSAVLDVPSANFSIGGWFKSTNTDLEALIGKVKFADDQWGLYQNSGKYYFIMRHDAGGSETGMAADAVYTAGTWYHVFGTVNSGLMTLYINGVAQTTTPTYTGTRPNTAANKFYIARRVDDNDYNLTGTVGEGYLSNRALALSEIQHDYQATKWRF